jgi:hypothetical protein
MCLAQLVLVMWGPIQVMLPSIMFFRAWISLFGFFSALKLLWPVSKPLIGGNEKFRTNPHPTSPTSPDDDKKNKRKPKKQPDELTWGDKILQYCKDNKWTICLSIGTIVIGTIFIIYNTKQGGDVASTSTVRAAATLSTAAATQSTFIKKLYKSETKDLMLLVKSPQMIDFWTFTAALSTLLLVAQKSEFVFESLKTAFKLTIGTTQRFQTYKNLIEYREMLTSPRGAERVAVTNFEITKNEENKLTAAILPTGDDDYISPSLIPHHNYISIIWTTWLGERCLITPDAFLRLDSVEFGKLVSRCLMPLYTNPDIFATRLRLIDLTEKGIALTKD